MTSTMKTIMSYFTRKESKISGYYESTGYDLQKKLSHISRKIVRTNLLKLVDMKYLYSNKYKKNIYNDKWEDVGNIEPLYDKYWMTANGVVDGKRGKFKSTMRKKLKQNIVKGIQEIGKTDVEYSYAIDFERELKTPERILITKGGKLSTQYLPDFELFGHSHPRDSWITPSLADIATLGNTKEGSHFLSVSPSKKNKGKFIIYNIKNKKKYKTFMKNMREKAIYEANGGYNFWVTFIRDLNLDSSAKDRKFYFGLTGIKVLPYKEDMMIEVANDSPKIKKLDSDDRSSKYYYQLGKRKRKKKKGRK